MHLRLIGVHTPKGYCFFLTNLPPRLGPRQVADLYRVRWEVELSIKLDKRFIAWTRSMPSACSVKTLLHASLIASIIAALLAHTHNLQTRPSQEGTSHGGAFAPQAPRVAAGRVLSVDRAGLRLEGSGGEAALAVDRELLTHSGKDPNWRRRPSVLDQLRGWKRKLWCKIRPTAVI